MTANAQDQVARMLALVPYLQAREGIRLDEVAEDFGVKPAQIVKDLNVLWFCGLPNAVTGEMIDIDMDALKGQGVIRLSNAEFLTRPLRLAPHEALALTVALRVLLETSGAERETVERTLEKIESAAGEMAARASAVDVHIDPVDSATRAAVTSALHGRRQLDLTYYVPGRDETTQRVVDPMRLIIADGQTYLEAWCNRVDEGRMFRLDRITEVTVLDTPSTTHASRRLDLSRGLFQPDDSDPVAVLELEPSARWMAGYFPTQSETELESGRLSVSLRFSDPGWLVRLVLRLGGEATLVEPPELAEAVRRRAADALAQYRSLNLLG
ncbi:MAG: helix-turn-helix transcriptional regulator [Nocardioidaceae bacterium]